MASEHPPPADPVPPRPETCGRTEEYIGRWMQARGNRGQVVLATKVMGGAKVGAALQGGAASRRDALLAEAQQQGW